ncbi:MAG: methyltransferase domain-containing protein [Acidobacteriota bacterium]
MPAPDRSQDAVLASLSPMYVGERAAAAQEIARVLRPASPWTWCPRRSDGTSRPTRRGRPRD